MKNNDDDLKLLGEWFWTDRWIGSSAFLLPLEPRGLYREMLTQAWRRAGRLPNNPEAIRRAVGCTEAEWERCWPVIQPYWRVEDDHIVNDTQLKILAASIAKHASAQERGRLGGLARAARMQAEREAKLQAKLPAKLPAKLVAKGVANGLAKSKPPSPSPSLSPDPDPSPTPKIKTVSSVPHAAHEPVAASPTVLSFPVVGSSVDVWSLTEAQIAEWSRLYPGFDVLGEARKALAWVLAKPVNRKTAKGMAGFLVNWFNRSLDRGVGRTAAPASRTAGNVDNLRRFAEKGLR